MLFIESIRGLAAFTVTAQHGITDFTPFASFNHGKFLIQALANGGLAVRILFVLSGIVLSLSFFRTGLKSVVTSSAIRRYFRVAFPVMISVLLSWGILRMGMYCHLGAIKIMAADHIAGSSLVDFTPDPNMGFFTAVWWGLIGAFCDGNVALNRVLWTMPIELVGSFLVFATLAIFGTVRNRGIIYLILAFLLQGLYLDFLCGIVFCDLYMSREKISRSFNMPLWGGILMIAGGTALGAGGSFWAWFGQHTGISFSSEFWYGISAAMIIWGAMASPAVQRLLAARPLVFLGKISFALYIVHRLINLSLGCALYTELRQAALPHIVSAVIVFFVCISISILAAWGLYYVADVPGIRLGKWIENRFFAIANRD